MFLFFMFFQGFVSADEEIFLELLGKNEKTWEEIYIAKGEGFKRASFKSIKLQYQNTWYLEKRKSPKNC